MLGLTQRIFLISLFIFVASCGDQGAFLVPPESEKNQTTTGGTGGSNNGGTNTDGTVGQKPAPSKVASLEVQASAYNIQSASVTPVTISVTAKDANNTILTDESVSFSVDKGATISPVASTQTTALKTAELLPGLNRKDNRDLNVRVSAGNIEKTIVVKVTDTMTAINGPSHVLANESTKFYTQARDSNGDGIAHQVLRITSRTGATITPTGNQGYTTDENGNMEFTYQSSVHGNDVIVLEGLGTRFEKSITVSDESFQINSPNEEISVGVDESMMLIWTKGNIPQSNQTINLSATRGTLSTQSVTTDARGRAIFSINSTKAGGSTITATTPNGDMSTEINREFVATAPRYATLSAEKKHLNPNDSVKLTAFIRDVNDNPIKNELVSFNLDDPGNGNLNQSFVRTDSSGKASVTYTANSNINANNDITITATVTSNAAVKGSITLSAGSEAMRLTIGINDSVAEEGALYKQAFSVIVSDTNGNPVPNQPVSVSVQTFEYQKGRYACVTDSNNKNNWIKQASSPFCPTEDLDNDNHLDGNEDFNGNGKLDPGSPASISHAPNTNEQGISTVYLTYPKSHSSWSRVRVTVSVSANGNEYQASTEQTLVAPVPGECKFIAYVESPFGTSNVCSNPN